MHMDCIGSPDLGPTLGSDPESLEASLNAKDRRRTRQHGGFRRGSCGAATSL